MIGKGNFTEEFKRDAVAQITERGYPVAEVSKKLYLADAFLEAFFGAAFLGADLFLG